MSSLEPCVPGGCWQNCFIFVFAKLWLAAHLFLWLTGKEVEFLPEQLSEATANVWQAKVMEEKLFEQLCCHD